MRVGIYTPYLDTIGGGEKYMLTIAETFLKKGDEVVLFLGTHLYNFNTDTLKENVKKIHGIDLENVTFLKGPFGAGSSTLERFNFLKRYDLFFYLTDGSIFYANAKRNILHFQVPFETFTNTFTNRLKLKSWNTTIFNSVFTKNIVAKNWPVKSGLVLYPPVSAEDIKPLKKEKIIVSVGRFHLATKSKKHEVMIDAFSELVKKKNISGWKLVLAGGMEEGNDAYIDELKKRAEGLPVEILVNISLSDLHTLYGKAMIYWHAAGFGEDDPKKHEHFGITTVESMAAGCVPVVINKGGQPEIVEEGSGFVWDSIEELLSKTKQLIDNENLFEKMSGRAILRSKIFDKQHFKQSLLDLVYER
jgi:glycosyltransferase involved in cell wall biosynthesis